MAVEYGQGKVNIAPDEKTKLIPKERIRRTKSEFFSVSFQLVLMLFVSCRRQECRG